MIKQRRLDIAFVVPDLTPKVRLVLIFIARKSNKTGDFFQSQTSLAADTEMSVSCVGKAIKVLVQKDMLELVSRGYRTTNRYRVLDKFMMPD